MYENGKNILINNTCFSPKKPLIIAELGTSHNGDIKKAKLMIDAAADAGAECAKFQIVYADEILHPNTGEVPLPGGNIRLYDKFKSLELKPEFYLEIKEHAESKGLLFLCTPFGPKSASILKELNPKMVKIASPELNYTSLLEEIAGWNLPVLLSSGVSRLSDIEQAIDIFKSTKSNLISNQRKPQRTNEGSQIIGSCGSWLNSWINDVILLHCVTAYPAPETDYNLRVLPHLSSVFGVPVGISDHSADPELVPALAVSMGAVVIEKHFCLSKADPGLDDPIALPPDEFAQMVKAVKFAAINGPEETISFYSGKRGTTLIEQVLGNGEKELAPSEKANYRLTNRSIHALRDIQAGEILKKSDYAVLRTEKVLRPGLEPSWEKKIEGKTVKQFIPAGEGIRSEDLLD